MFSQCMFLFVQGEEKHSPDTCVAGVATQPKDVPALVMRFCLQLLLGELHTRNFFESCHNLRQDDRKKPRVNGKQWKRLVGMKRPGP